jgi:hypothetical protein
MNWLTNSPEAAKALSEADSAYDAARKAGQGLPLAEKISAYRKAKEDREAAYAAVRFGRDRSI